MNKEMAELGRGKSAIRELYEYGLSRLEAGLAVYDYSLGNPSVGVAAAVERAILLAVKEDMHGYTVASGLSEVRESIAGALNKRYGTSYDAGNIFMVSGAAAAITIALKAMLKAGEEVIVSAPYFPEYKVFVEGAGGVLKVVRARSEDWQVDVEAMRDLISERTAGIIINSPNNPSGVVYSEETLAKIGALAGERDLIIISDEPYRELTYGAKVAWVPTVYKKTLVCYSYSKSYSLAGERIGYILIPDELEEYKAAVAGAARSLGHVNAPVLWQKVIGKCAGMKVDVSEYAANGRLLYKILKGAGYECSKPQGAFYLWVKSLEPDEEAFCARAKEYGLLLVPSRTFGVRGYFRAAYCVKREMIEESAAAFKELAASYA